MSHIDDDECSSLHSLSRIVGDAFPELPYQDEDADITLISSDNVIFKVHAYHLQAASQVGAAFLEEDSTEIHLVDRDIESAAVVRNVLDFLHDAMFELSDDLESIQTNILASRFMEKYDMASLLRHRDNILKEHAHRADFSHRAVFILASAADRLEICAIVIRRNARLPTPGQPEARRHIMETGEINRLLDSQHCLDIVSWPYCFVELIPRPYGESLHRAFRKAGVFNSDWSKVAGHFEALMQEHKEAGTIRQSSM